MTDRKHVTYTGDQPLFLPGSVAPRPDYVETDTVVEVDAQWVEALLARGDFKATPEGDVPDPAAPLAVPEPVPAALAAARAAVEAQPELDKIAADVDHFVDPDELTGEALEAALRSAGLPVSGTASEKRDRLADWQTEQRQRLARGVVAAGAAGITTTTKAEG